MTAEEFEIDFAGVQRITEAIYRHNNENITTGGFMWAELEQWIADGGVVDESPYQAKLIKDAKKAKLQELEQKYSMAQIALLQNGYSFYLSLRGEYFELLRNTLNEAKEEGYSFVRLTAINGLAYVGKLPYALLTALWESVNLPVSKQNWHTKQNVINFINNSTDTTTVNNINIDNIFVVNTIFNINAFCNQIVDPNNTEVEQSVKDYLSYKKVGDQYNIFTPAEEFDDFTII